jgi:uncharacterized protein (TIGR03067 family)
MSVIVTIFATLPAGAEPAEPGLTGTWLFDSAAIREQSQIGRFWTSQVRVTGDRFALSKFMELSKDLTGQIVLNAAESPKTIDMKLDEYDLEAAGAGVKLKIPAGTAAGIYKLDGERLTICVNTELGGPRPKTFTEAGEKVALITLVRAPAGFNEFPKKIAVTVVDENGKPAAGAIVTGSMSMAPNRQAPDAKPEWQYFPSVKTGSDGVSKLNYDEFRGSCGMARDVASKRIAIADVSPARLVAGHLRLALQPECRVVGTIVCPKLEKAGKPIGWTNLYVVYNGERFAFHASKDGKFELILPPGKYTLFAYGSDFPRRSIPISVPAGRDEFAVPPIALTASRLVLLRGKSAPELAGVVGWKGAPVKLADLKGKYVLLDFTGYWCGPCMGSMPVLIELHEKFADKGLAIVAVHVDGDGEVTSAAELDEKFSIYRKDLWKGKDVPFPVALVSGKQIGEGEGKPRGVTAEQYGVHKFPTCILIDREGRVVREFNAVDAKIACAEIEKLLNEKK